MPDVDLTDAYLQELRRGIVVVASLLALQAPNHGYALLTVLEEAGVPVAANTLYPLLRRLESQHLLASSWDTGQARPRKIYRTSREGVRVARLLQQALHGITEAIDRLAATNEHEGH